MKKERAFVQNKEDNLENNEEKAFLLVIFVTKTIFVTDYTKPTW